MFVACFHALAQTTLIFNTQPATISNYQQQTESMDLRLPLASSKDSSPDEKSIFLTQKTVKLCLEDQSRDGITSTKSKEPRTSRSSLEPLKDSTNTRTSALHQQGVQLDRPYSHVSGAYDFPLLKNHEVLQYMNETDFRSTESELLEPHIHKEKTLKAFRHVLNHCLGLTVEDVDKKATSRSSRSMELSKDGTSNVPLFLTLQACLTTCCVHDFSWKDIHAPTPKRFRIHMSACIHLAKFRTERRVLYQKRLRSRDDLFKELHGIQKEREGLQEQLDQMQTESGEKMEEAGQDVRVCEELAWNLRSVRSS